MFQENSDTTSGTVLEKNFSFFVGESTPVVQSAFVELKGLAASGASTQSIDMKIKQQGGSYGGVTTFNFDVPNRAQTFKVRYDVTSFMAGIITTAGTYNFTQYVKNNGPSSISVLNAKLIMTYQFTPPSSGYRSTGYIISSTFDTASTNGAAPNAIMWQGTLPSTSHVKFQFASSNCSNGTTNPPTCTTGTWSYIGPDGTTGTFYEPSNQDVPLELDLSTHNNKRYFKYKVILNPTNDASGTPTVTDIILNWAP